MFEWIISEKHWIFSGVGVAIVGWLFFRGGSKGDIKASKKSVAAKNLKNSQVIIGDKNKTKE